MTNIRYRKVTPLALLIVLVGIIISGCSVLDDSHDARLSVTPIEKVSVEKLARGYADFAFEMFEELARKTPDENILFSGASLTAALAMLYEGAEGATKEEIARLLKTDDISMDQFHAAHAAWLRALEETGELEDSADRPGPISELSIANSVWARAGFPFEEAYLQRSRDVHGAQVEAIDFADPASVDVINAWVSDKTRGRIDSIVDSIDPLEIMLLINAVYFLGQWSEPFAEGATSVQPFRLSDDSFIQVPMMTRRGMIEYASNEAYEAVRLPYGEDERFAMYVFVPEWQRDLSSLYENLDARTWAELTEQFRPIDLELNMPRFTMEYKKQLEPVLKALGMERAFHSGRSDFSHMTRARDDVHVGTVLQKSFVQVNETGTEAAAVTSISVRVTSLPTHRVMRVDRPFFFVIEDGKTGTILFQGQVVRPEDPDWDGHTH